MEEGVSVLRPIKLSFARRAEIFDKTVAKVTKDYFDPKFNGVDWPKLARERRDSILSLSDPEAFELAMHDLVRSLGTSHTGFFHQSVRRVPARLAIGATFGKVDGEAGPTWTVRDVHEGGPANAAGLRPLDVLKAINGTAVAPPHQPMFPMGASASLLLQRGSEDLTLTVTIPAPRSRKQPYAEMKAVAFSILENNVGYLKVSILPGLLGLNVARDIDAAVSELADCDHLILDLRGHLGGGLGVLRLMSHLTPGKLPIGFTLTRKLAEKGYDKNKLRRLDRLPTHLPNPLAIASMALKFAGRGESVLLVSEGLGTQKWHGSIAILVNEHTVSAGEMVAAFARENGLATLLGAETAGRLIPGSGFKVGDGYMLIMPTAEYVTWLGHRFEGASVKPDIPVSWSVESFVAGKDNQLQIALDFLCMSNCSLRRTSEGGRAQ
jgi:C-terminal processing protease CtpA/Prc